MAGFGVRPEALDTYAKIVADPNGATSSMDHKYLIDAGDYTDVNVKLEDGAGGIIFKAIVEKTADVHRQLIADNSTISAALIGSANGLIASAQRYRENDASSAQKIDSVYQPGGITPRNFSVDDTAAPVDPASKLTAPSGEGAVPDLVQQILDGAGYFSESDLVIKILNWCGLDVMGWVKDKFFGDFGAIAKVKNAIGQLSDFDLVVVTDLAEGADVMFKSWSGNAAAAATSYFDQLTNAIEGHAGALRRLTDKYNDVLLGIQEAAATLEGLLTGAIDFAVEAALAVAAAGCLQEVPGLNILIDIVGAWRVTKVINQVHKVMGYWNWTWSGSEGIMAIAAGTTGILADYNVAAKLPKAGYYNASQGSAPKSGDEPDRKGGPR
jgi:uncharacterized protein YukE